jgi:hypothetical protein
MGPWIVTADEVDPANMEVRCWVNGELRQDANTRDLIIDVPHLISWASTFYTLNPGDILMTGTPEGVERVVAGDTIDARTYEYDQEMAKKMNEARATAREGLPVYKEYPEGYKWVELNKPGAFANESEAMGHSVRGYEPPKGHPDWVEGSGYSGSLGYGHGGWEAIKSGKAKVFSLVDPKGAPHATVEVGKSQYAPRHETVLKYKSAAEQEAKSIETTNTTSNQAPYKAVLVTGTNRSKYLMQKLTVEEENTVESLERIKNIVGKFKRFKRNKFFTD